MKIITWKQIEEKKKQQRREEQRREIMATVHFSTLSIRKPVISTTNQNYRKPIFSSSVNMRSIAIPRATSSSESPPSPEKPKIELEFIGPKPGDPIDKASEISGEKLLRSIMSDNKIELYATYGKVMNCGGGGSCGTCIVEIIDGSELLNERTNTELRYLKKKPESWRLACQTIVGNKENSGKVVVQRLPQWKK